MNKLEEIKKLVREFKEVDEILNAFGKEENPLLRNWSFSTLNVEAALDAFMQQLAALDKKTAIQFAAVFVRYAFEHVRENHMDQIREFGFAFFESDPCMDGDSIGKQLFNVENWLSDPSPENEEVVANGVDPSRQMNIWEEDLYPSEDQMWQWIIETAQLLSMAVTAKESEEDDDGESPYEWSYKACASRSAICSLKTVSQLDTAPEQNLAAIFKKIGVML